MASFTLQVVKIATTHQTSNPYAGRLVGDLIGIYNRITDAPSKNTRLGFIHIDDAPDSLTLNGVRESMVNPNELTPSPLSDALSTTPPSIMVDLSLWRANLTDSQKNELQLNAEIIIPWADMLDICYRKSDSSDGNAVFAVFEADL